MKYEKQANDFLNTTGTTFKAEKIGYGKYFSDDKGSRDIYQITLTRNGKTYSFRFGQSIKNSELPIIACSDISYQKEAKLLLTGYVKKGVLLCHHSKAPTAYDVLASIRKNDPEDFETFCSEFGYDLDSRKAFDVYLAVQTEYKNIYMLFSDCMEQLQEIN